MYLWRNLASLEDTYVYCIKLWLMPGKALQYLTLAYVLAGTPPEGGWLHGKLLSSMTLGFAGGQRIILDTHAIKTSKRSIGVCLSISLWVYLLTLFGARATSLNISSPKDQTMLLSKTSALVWTTDSVEQGLCTNGDYHPLNMLPFMCLFRTYINP